MASKIRLVAALGTTVLGVAVILTTFATAREIVEGPEILSGATETTVTLDAVADAALISDLPDDNFGEEDWLEISYLDSGEHRAATILRFDLSSLPSDAVIDTAELRLFLEDAGGASPASIVAYYVTGSWDESTVTWNNAPLTGPSGVAASIDDVAGSYKGWNVSSYAQSWVDDPSANHGILLLGPQNLDYERWFASRETMDLVPQLDVTYHLHPYSFSGHVYEGEPEDTSTPAVGVAVELWGDEDEWPEAGFERELLVSTTTSRSGAFSLEWQPDAAWPFVHVIEVDPAGTVSSGATADPPGTVKNYNVVSYRRDDMLETGSYDFDGIGFWDRLAATDTPTPSNTPTATDTSTPTSTPTDTPTPTPTETPAPTDTHTPPATPSATPTSTSGPTDTPTPTPTATLPADCEELLINGDFETGSLSPWTSFGDIGLGPGYSSAYGAQLGGVDEAGGELYQWATFPEGADPVQLSFWWRVDGAFEDPGDFVVVLMQYDEEVDEVLKMRAEAPLGEWRQEMVDLTPYVGQTVLVTFLVNTNQEDTTTFRLDDVSLLACGRATPTPTHTPTTTPTEEPPREWVVNTTLDHDDGQCSPLDVGDCTLREAINAANQAGEPNSIRFDISEDDAGFEEGRWTIRPHSPLPDLTDDGIEMGACAEQPLIVLDGALASRGSSGLALRGAGQAVRGLVLTRWSGSGVHISSAAAHNNTVACNEIMDNWGHGVLIDEAAHHNAIGGELGGNWIAGNGGDGVHIGGAGTDANQVTGNVIGADRAATAAWPNVGHGVRIADSAQFNALGGEEPDERNIIAGNAHSGVMVEGEDTDFNTITNNLIGIGADGQTRLPNGNHGVGLYSGAAHNEVGTSASAPNVIGANGWSGVAIVRSASNTVMGNQIGLDSAAGEDLGNAAYGVHVVASSDNELVANSVARNGSDGVRVEGEAALHNRISLNAITDNGGEGIRLLSGGNGDLLPPAIITVTRTSVSGTACPGCTVEVFSDPADEGAYVHSPPYATADSSGAWTWYGSVTGANVTATATDADGNTSPFASDGLLFSGQIMLAEGIAAQRTGVTPIPIPKPVQVVLYGSYDPGELGEPLLSVPTGRDGSFVMSCAGSGCLRPLPFFNLVVDDPGFVVQRAESRSGGRVTDQGWIQFEMGGVAARADSDVRYAGPFPDNDFWVEAVTEADPDVILEPVDTVPRMPPVGAAEEVDFQIAGIEVTQAIQCYSDKDSGTITTGCANDNDLPLVAGKPAVVRVDVSAGICSPPEGRGPVRVDLGVQSATAVYTTQTHFKAACATSAERRQHVDATANFYLQKPEAGTVSVWAEVNSDRKRTETDYTNNRYPASGSVEVLFETRRRLKIEYVLVSYQPSDPVTFDPYAGPSLPSPQWVASEAPHELARAIYPTHAIDRAGPTYTLHWGNEPDVRENGSALLLNDLATLRHYWGLVCPSCLGAYPNSVFAWLPAPALEGAPETYGAALRDVAYGVERRPETFAHLVGHMLGLDDAPCPWGSLPVTNDEWPYDHGQIQEVGFDVTGKSVVEPHCWDVMSYCTPAWISPFHWRKLHDALAPAIYTATATAQSPTASYALVSGVVSEDGSGTLDPLMVLESSAQPPAPPTRGETCLTFYGPGQQVLSSHCFDPSFIDADGSELPASAGFAYVLPYPTGASQLALLHDEVLLDERAASAHAPEVSVQTPTGGESWDGIRTVEWAATDADGDDLTFALQYSDDGGERWMPVAIDLVETSVLLDTTSLPGSDEARVRVLTSDGFHTAIAESPILTVPTKAPRALVGSPSDMSELSPHQAVLLEGSAHDPEEGALSGSALSWWSDRDGLLGRGETVVVPGLTLSLGEHRLTLKATDSDRQIGEAHVTVLVGQRVYLPIVLRKNE